MEDDAPIVETKVDPKSIVDVKPKRMVGTNGMCRKVISISTDSEASSDHLVVSPTKSKKSAVLLDIVGETLEEKIISYLTQTKGEWPIPTTQIAKYVVGPGSSRKSINPTIYKIEKEGLVVKVSEANGTKPKWSLIE
jgi:hypothetical protein